VIAIDHHGPLAVLTIDNPPVNLWDAGMQEGLTGAVRELVAAPPRALLIRAEGRVVTGGVDVNVFAGLTADSGGTLWQDLLQVIHDVEDLPCPTIFAAHALCLTWGLELALACDLLVASEKAKFGLVERVVGIAPSMGGPQRLALRAGPARAKELVYTGELYSAETLHEWGVVTRLLPADGFDDGARAYARQIAEGPTKAFAVSKRLVSEAVEHGARAADALVPEHAGALFDTEDARNAIASFLAEGPGKATYEGR